MATTKLIIIAGLGLIILFFIGLSFILNYLIRKVQGLLKPRVPLRVRDPKELELLIKSIRSLSLEERLLMLRIVFGDYGCYLKVDESGVIIEGVGKRSIQENDELSESIG